MALSFFPHHHFPDAESEQINGYTLRALGETGAADQALIKSVAKFFVKITAASHPVHQEVTPAGRGIFIALHLVDRADVRAQPASQAFLCHFTKFDYFPWMFNENCFLSQTFTGGNMSCGAVSIEIFNGEPA